MNLHFTVAFQNRIKQNTRPKQYPKKYDYY